MATGPVACRHCLSSPAQEHGRMTDRPWRMAHPSVAGTGIADGARRWLTFAGHCPAPGLCMYCS
jgi:hypothetical protein